MTNSKPGNRHPHSRARAWALKFMYQCECERIYFYAPALLEEFFAAQKIMDNLKPKITSLVSDVYADLNELDAEIQKISTKWTIARMPVIDRCLVRIGIAELKTKSEPPKSVINDIIELAKEYSTENSPSFLNGVLDRYAKEWLS